MIQLAAFWEKESKNNRTYYQGKLGNARLLLFKNEKRDNDKAPDLILYIVQDKRQSKQDDSGY
ncbi:MAG: hypothetical protein ACFFCW_18110 [Candidatus Hodarchaeota archaeon]